MNLKSRFIGLAVILLLTICQCCNREQAPHYPDHQQVLRLCVKEEPLSLDPRKGNDRRSRVTVQALFEGLMRISPDNEPVWGMADGVEISEDQCTYIFHLRDAMFSNGDPITAYDFEATWKEMLTPDFDSTFSYQFYLLKNAEQIKRGELPVSDLGVKATDSHTLVVQLAHPAPYFLYHMGNPLFAPICSTVAEANPQWHCEAGPDFVCNGAFRLKEWRHGDEIIVEKNPYYWDADTVQLDQIRLAMLEDSFSALEMFEAGEFDWLGDPLLELPLGAIAGLRNAGRLHTCLSGTVFKLDFNTESPPLHCAKLRRALFYAIDRGSLIEHVLKGGEKVIASLVPHCIDSRVDLFTGSDREEACRLLAEALTELDCTVEELPVIHYTYPHIDRYKLVAQALQQRWEEVLGVRVVLESKDWYSFVRAFKGADLQVAGVEWYSCYNDPIYNLERIKHKGGFSASNWFRSDFAALLSASDQEMDQDRRSEMLAEAQQIAMLEMPTAPLYEVAYKYLASPKVQGIFISSLGQIDFKWASLEFADRCSTMQSGQNVLSA